VDGILLVDKPKGWTSHDVVAKIRNVILTRSGQKVKVGHAGTLDPMASGLLLVLVGGYTSKAGSYLKLDKTYEAELTLGAVSSTGDSEGKITHTSDKIPSNQQIKEAVSKFIGTIKQVPPAYSAIKIKGQEAYKLARAGLQFKLEPRVVTIYDIKIKNYNYPKLNLIIYVSSGTYIRSLAQDIGSWLGVGAYLSALRRTKVGQFDIKNAIRVEQLTPNNVQDKIKSHF
jgi:tRNA pseudouridine55 synthase